MGKIKSRGIKMNLIELRKILLKEGLSDERGVDILTKLLEYRSKKLDRCGDLNCNNEHILNNLLEEMRNRKNQRTKQTKGRLELEKEELIRKGFRVAKVKGG